LADAFFVMGLRRAAQAGTSIAVTVGEHRHEAPAAEGDGGEWDRVDSTSHPGGTAVMNRAGAILAILGLVAAGFGCAPPAGDGSRSDESTAVDDLVRRWDEAMASGDPQRVVALYVADGPAAMPPDRPAHIGATGIGVLFRNMFSGGTIEVRNRVDQVLASGDVVIARGSYTQTVRDESGQTREEAGKWIAVTRRNPDGSLSIQRNLWNRDAAPPGSVPEPPLATTGSPGAAEDAECLDTPSALDTAFNAHWAAGDVAALVANHAAQGSRLPPGRPIVTGRDAIGAYLRAYADLFQDRRLLPIEAGEEIDGDLGVTWGRHHMSFIYAGEGVAGRRIEGQGKYIAVATRGEDGCWRHEWVIWNHDSPQVEVGS